jgi:hypothetical protein
MKNNHSRQETTRVHTRSSLIQVIHPDLVIHAGISALDQLCGGFKAGELILIDGNSSLIATLPDQLCVTTYQTFHSATIYIDAGMRANPYQIARYARLRELDQREVLQNVLMSRAFTVYQLSTILQELLEPILQSHSPRTLLIGMLPALYQDPELSRREAQMLLLQDLQKLQQLTSTHQLITVCTNLDTMPLSPSKSLGKTLYDNVTEVIRIKHINQCICLELVKKQKSTTIVHDAKGQLRLEAFGMVC